MCGCSIDVDFSGSHFNEVRFYREYDDFDPTVTAPPAQAGKLFSQVLNEYAWTPENKAELEHRLRYSNHVDECYGPNDSWDQIKSTIQKRVADMRAGKGPLDEQREITYPDIEEAYTPPETCSARKSLDMTRVYNHHHKRQRPSVF